MEKGTLTRTRGPLVGSPMACDACSAIDLAIAMQLKTVEAGAQGEHKLARGYLPTPTWSVHWMRDEGFARAIADYLQAERDAVDQEIEILTEYGPFRRAQIEEQQ